MFKIPPIALFSRECTCSSKGNPTVLGKTERNARARLCLSDVTSIGKLSRLASGAVSRERHRTASLEGESAPALTR